MGKLFLCFAVAIASLALAESLTCNSCTVSLFGFCLNSKNVSCSGDNQTCYSGKATFPSVSSFSGFSNQGCRLNSTCGNSTGTLLGFTYNVNITCCSTDKCNPLTSNGPPSTKMTFTAAIAGAILATVLGSKL